MCLSYVKKRYWFADKKVYRGYKTFYDYREESHYIVTSKNFDNPFVIGCWYKAKPVNCLFESGATDNKWYRPYFHIICDLEDAIKWQQDDGGVLYEVEYSHVTAHGIQDGAEIDIAKRMRVIGKVIQE